MPNAIKAGKTGEPIEANSSAMLRAGFAISHSAAVVGGPGVIHAQTITIRLSSAHAPRAEKGSTRNGDALEGT